MSAKLLPIVLSALFSIASAAVTPTGPAPGAVFNEGADCLITWDADTTGAWTDLKIKLMNGDNFNMIPLTTVVDGLDGTKSPGTFTWTCPDVGLNAPIFFYEFTNGAATGEGNVFWTGRWTIADADGKSVAAPNTDKDGNGNSYNWGVTTLATSGSNSTFSASDASSATSSSSADSSSSSVTAETSSEASTDTSSATSAADDSSSQASSTSSSTAAQQTRSETVDSGANSVRAGVLGAMVAGMVALLI